MERSANIAFMVLMLVPVVIFFGIQNLYLIREMNLLNRKKTSQQENSKNRASAMTSSSASPLARPSAKPATTKKAHGFQVVKGRSQERKKALFR